MTFKMTVQSRTTTIYNYRSDTMEFISKEVALNPPLLGSLLTPQLHQPPRFNRDTTRLFMIKVRCEK